jgi:hypothetical protein
MGLIEELLGCSLYKLDRSYWAVKLDDEKWICETQVSYDWRIGTQRNFDWSNDLVATGDVLRIKELWLFCPPNKYSPVGNTARLIIEEPGTAFQFKVGHADSNIAVTWKTMQGHIIGKVTNKEQGLCECFIWDPIQQGMITPETMILDPKTMGPLKDEDGNIIYAGKTSVYNFHSWRPGSVAPLGKLHLQTLGVYL